jgi:hypothetical protein
LCNKLDFFITITGAWRILQAFASNFSVYRSIKSHHILFAEKVPVRFNVAVMLFMACFTAYMIRTNISIVMIPMIKESDANNTVRAPQNDVCVTISRVCFSYYRAVILLTFYCSTDLDMRGARKISRGYWAASFTDI